MDGGCAMVDRNGIKVVNEDDDEDSPFRRRVYGIWM